MNRRASTTAAKLGLSALAGLALVGTVTGCSSGAASASGSDDSTVSTPSASASAATPAARFADGKYREIGHYDSPAGAASITVAVTLKAGVITEVKVTPHATNPTAKIFQGEFVAGIAAVVVGKKIDQISVSKVSGSSLTGSGFRQAIEKIKTDATA